MESRGIPAPVPETAALLFNNSGRKIIVFDFVWRYRTTAGRLRKSSLSNLYSSGQREVLSGHSKIGRDLGTFILPGSRRLITERSIFGNNLDVLGPDELPCAGGNTNFSFNGGIRGGAQEDLAAVELVLGLVILEDGLCTGPDKSGLFEELNEPLDLLRRTSLEAVEALRKGASLDWIFEIVRPLRNYDTLASQYGRKPSRAISLVLAFAHEAVAHLVNASEAQLLAWFEAAAQPRTLRLRRPL